MRWLGVCASALVMIAGSGCRSPLAPKTKSAFDRDPLVMAHLTHSKDDPAYRETESDVDGTGENQLQPASARQSFSKKPIIAEVIADSYGAPVRSRAADYSWIRGTVSKANRGLGPKGWFVEYGRSEKDRFGGKLRLAETPRLGLLREGDTVHLTGKIRAEDPTNPTYEIQDIILLR